MSYPTSVTAVPTTASPTTSSPTTTSSSNSNAPTSTYPATTATTPIATSLTSVATTVPTTITSTNQYGSTTVITTDIYTTTPVVSPTPSPVNNSSNTGAIVGGVIGGIVVIALLGLLLFWLRRRRRRHRADGSFEPDRIVSHPSTHPPIDLGEENVTTPFDSYMRERGDSTLQGAGAGPAGVGVGAAAAGVGTGAAAVGAAIGRTTSQPSPSLQHSVTDTSPDEDPFQGFIRPGPGDQGGQSMYAMQEADSATPRPLTSPAASVGASSGRMTKEQEAAATAAGRQGPGLSTQQEVDGEGSGVVQHRDVGQVLGVEEGREPRDVPPAYESITQ